MQSESKHTIIRSALIIQEQVGSTCIKKKKKNALNRFHYNKIIIQVKFVDQGRAPKKANPTQMIPAKHTARIR